MKTFGKWHKPPFPELKAALSSFETYINDLMIFPNFFSFEQYNPAEQLYNEKYHFYKAKSTKNGKNPMLLLLIWLYHFKLKEIYMMVLSVQSPNLELKGRF